MPHRAKTEIALCHFPQSNSSNSFVRYALMNLEFFAFLSNERKQIADKTDSEVSFWRT
jgi:hypothetical protein